MKNFNWGDSNDWYRSQISTEIFEMKIYEKFFDVEENDIVVDIGASIGPFAHSIKDKKFKHIYCFEPSVAQIPTLIKNIAGLPATLIPKGLSNVDGKDTFDLYGKTNGFGEALSFTFQSFIEKYKIDKIDFLKTDCEGGEYCIFNLENVWWVKQNIKKIVGEFHLENPEKKEKFRLFRDLYLKIFDKVEVYSTDGETDIKWDLWNEHFIQYYRQVVIYIDNR